MSLEIEDNSDNLKDVLNYITTKIENGKLTSNESALINKFVLDFIIEQNIIDETEYNMQKYLVLGWYIYNIKKN